MPRKRTPTDTAPATGTAATGTGTGAAASADPLALDRQLCFALYSASLTMTKLYKPLLDPLGLTYPQYLVMLVLWQDNGLMVSQLGERLALDSGTLTPLLKRLEASGHVLRLRDSADERRVLVQLTTRGRALRTRAGRVPTAVALATGCELSEITSLTARLQALRLQLTEPRNGS